MSVQGSLWVGGLVSVEVQTFGLVYRAYLGVCPNSWRKGQTVRKETNRGWEVDKMYKGEEGLTKNCDDTGRNSTWKKKIGKNVSVFG